MSTVQGPFTALITPFRKNQEVDFQLLPKLVQRQLDHGNGVFCNGTNGEFYATTSEEKIRIAETALATANDASRVMAHIGCPSTYATIQLGREMQRAGMKAVSAITPYFLTTTQEELITHYRTIADELDMALYLYNIPGLSKNVIEPETLRTLLQHPNIKGIKDSAGSAESLDGFLSLVDEGAEIMTGPDSLNFHGYVRGAVGVISGLANLIPDKVNECWQKFRAGDLKGAEDVQAYISGVRGSLYRNGYPPATVKAASCLMCEATGDSRLPKRLTPEQLKGVEETIREFNLHIELN